jgi:hypothetical protein
MPTSSRRRLVGLLAAATCVATSAASAQATSVQDGETVAPLFRSEAPLAVTFTANLGQLRDDKKHGDKAPWRGATLNYKGADSALVRVPVRAKVHGIWRLAHCDFPPIRLNFAGKDTKNTVFDNVDKPKLTNYCRDTDAYEQYVLQELQLYRIYQLLTPMSHQVRLLRVTYADGGSGRTEAVRYGFLLEDPDQMAARLGGKLTKLKGAGIDDFEQTPQAVVYLFEYLIGNTDFSFNQLHNGEIVALPDGRNLPVAYDFDFAGAVNTRYATPDPSIRITKVRYRKFRGYCQLTPEFVKAIPIFQQKKDAIYALYRDEIGRLLDPMVVRETLDYFNEFYDAIGDPGKADRVIFRDCLGPR